MQTDEGFFFLGCANGTITAGPATGWSHVEFPAVAGTIESVELIADEEGQSVVDNISVDGNVVGKPGSN